MRQLCMVSFVMRNLRASPQAAQRAICGERYNRFFKPETGMCAVLQGHKHDGLSKPAATAILEQLDRLLASPYFSHSRRFPNFMRFVVEHTLAGDVDDIKERTLGIEIFGKDADYDTAADPIVRVTAAEIRKRVAQYYQDPAHDEELRITLPSGSYIPQFHSPKGATDHGLPEVDSVAHAAGCRARRRPLRLEPQGHRACSGC